MEAENVICDRGTAAVTCPIVASPGTLMEKPLEESPKCSVMQFVCEATKVGDGDPQRPSATVTMVGHIVVPTMPEDNPPYINP